MSLSTKDTDVYRKDEKTGHRLLAPDRREALLKPYLPSPPSRSPTRHDKQQGASRFGVRRFLRTQLHLLAFTIIHLIFSVYIRLRITYREVSDRVVSVLHYHHRTPEYIERDAKALRKVPKHLSVILKLEDGGRAGDALEKLVNEVTDIAAWCSCAGIPLLSVYEKTGILKGYMTQVHRATTQKLTSYYGRHPPALTLQCPHAPSIESAHPNSHPHLTMMLLSIEDGRDSIVDLTKTLAEMSQAHKISASDINIELINAELSESVMPDPDLLISFAPWVGLEGYPPWQIRLTEIYCSQDNREVGYQIFLRGLKKFAGTTQKLGK